MKLTNLSKTHQVVLTSLMAAINVIFALLATHFMGLGLIILLFLPLTSVIVALNVNLKYYPVYFFATMGLALIINLASIENTLFFLLPVLLSGLAFGGAIKLNLSDIYIISLVTVVNFTTSLLTIPFINVLYEIDFISIFLNTLGVGSTPLGYHLFPTILITFAAIQTIITFFIIQNDGHYFSVKINSTFNKNSIFFALGTLVITSIVMFFNNGVALSFMFFATLFTTYLVIQLISKYKKIGIITTVSALLSGLISVSLFESLSPLPFYFGFVVPFFLIVIVSFLWLYIHITEKETITRG